MVRMQDLFYEDDTVLFIDMHQNEVWPGSGQINECGTGKGEGNTINVPMPGTSTLLPLLEYCLASIRLHLGHMNDFRHWAVANDPSAKAHQCLKYTP